MRSGFDVILGQNDRQRELQSQAADDEREQQEAALQVKEQQCAAPKHASLVAIVLQRVLALLRRAR